MCFFTYFKYASPVTFWLCAWQSWKKYFPFSLLVLNKGTVDDGKESGSYWTSYYISGIWFSFQFNFFLMRWNILVHLCLHFFPFVSQCPLWNNFSGSICSGLQSNYAITKTFIIRLLKLNVEKNWFSFIQSYQFHSSLLSAWLKKHGRSKSKTV